MAEWYILAVSVFCVAPQGSCLDSIMSTDNGNDFHTLVINLTFT